MNKRSRNISKILHFLFLGVPSFICHAQKIQLLDSNHNVSLRGLSVVNNQICWASGSKGSVAISKDGGKSIEWMKVTGYENRDFRDIEAWDENTALIMAIDTPAIILKTINGGKSWEKVFEDTRSGMFLDAMFFKNKKKGIVVGDPIDGKFFLAQTVDGGESWSSWQQDQSSLSDSGESLFAASGTNITIRKGKVYYVSGGLTSHIITGTNKISLPMNQGKSSAGANSIDRSADGRMIVAGGDFSADSVSVGNCVITDDEGKTFFFPKQGPYGYKSCIVYLGKNRWIACGTSGVDISIDHGITWKNISKESFHVVQKAKAGNKILLAGKNGRIAEIIFNK
jgi:photosystem II stability/assembly factor-like uncharacterized protein